MVKFIAATSNVSFGHCRKWLVAVAWVCITFTIGVSARWTDSPRAQLLFADSYARCMHM